MTIPDDPIGGPASRKPLVSIITPVLNRASTLPSCLASVVAQTYPRIEHIVVDGGSTDGTLDILRSFSVPRPPKWITERDEGMYDALNKGLSLATGDVLAYLNSDDLYLPWSVDVAVEELRKGRDLVYGDLGVLTLRTVRGKPKSKFWVQFYPPFELRYYTHVATMGQPAVFWRRSLTDEIGGFDTTYRLIGDCEYWLRAATAGRYLAHVNEVLAVQVDHGDTLRATQSERLAEEFRRMRTQYSDFAAAPRFPKLHGYKRGFRWRIYQWIFLVVATRNNPKRWPRFIEFLRRHGFRLNRFGTLILFTLPSKLRPSGTTWVDTSMFEKAILEDIGSHELGPLVRPFRK